MIVTKYPQSCLVIEESGRRLVIDPGSFVADKYSPEDLGPIDLVLITHEHSDHLDLAYLDQILSKNPKAEVWGNQSVADLISKYINKVVVDGEINQFYKINIKSVDIPHVLMPNGQPGPHNTGYIISDILFHPGDGLETIETVDVVAAPLAGPDISPKDVVEFIKKTNAKKVIPIHYDYWPAKPDMFTNLFSSDVQYLVLENGQSLEL